MTNIFIIFISAFLNILLLFWWRKSCEHDDSDVKFPTLGHSIILDLFSFIPIWGMIQFCVLIAFYLGMRSEGILKLKPTKFNKKFFDVE